MISRSQRYPTGRTTKKVIADWHAICEDDPVETTGDQARGVPLRDNGCKGLTVKHERRRQAADERALGAPDRTPADPQSSKIGADGMQPAVGNRP
jgi:hypothetical protein